jgi:uncharacterized protein (DUF58 family)
MVGLILSFIIAYLIPVLFPFCKLLVGLFVIAFVLDHFLLFRKIDPLLVSRNTGDRFNNGDENPVQIRIENQISSTLKLTIIDEVPFQFQKRDLHFHLRLNGFEKVSFSYQLIPVERGEYEFGAVHCFIRSFLGLLIRRYTVPLRKKVKVYPSYNKIRQFEIIARSSELAEIGNRKFRKIGQSMEFDQIKDYVSGDDIRNINWRATARRGGKLMVNSFMDERSQQIYCLVDKGRVMKMPFHGMSLLDHAINATLVLSHVALVKQDRAGLITFAEDTVGFLPAEKRSSQMSLILENLYGLQTKFFETDYEKLYSLVRTRIPQRSLLVLFTNFESMSGLRRQLPYLRMMARKHLLLVIFFENVELTTLEQSEAQDIEGIYIKTIARKFILEKKTIVKELQQHGILTLLTTPQSLTIDAVNKYLELKSRQAI